MVPEPLDDGESEKSEKLSRRKAIQMGLVTIGATGLAGCGGGGSGDTDTPADTPTDDNSTPTPGETTGTPTSSPSEPTATDTPDEGTDTATPEPVNFETLTIPKGSITPGEYSDLGDSLLSLSEFAIYEGEAGEGDVWAWWDEDNFYFAADVVDEDYIINNGSAGGLWDNDCFQIGLAPGQPGSTSNFSELTIGDASTGEVTGPHLHHRYVPAGEDSVVLEEAETDVTRLDGEGRTQYSFAVSWDSLSAEMSPEEGGDFSLTIARHDPDDDGENWLNYGGGMLGGKEPFGLGTAVYGEGSSEGPETVTVNQGAINVDDFSHLGEPTATLSEFELFRGDELGEGDVWVRWDEDNFYFAADIWNPEFVNDVGTGSGNWDNDAFQVGIAPGQPGAESNFVEINFSDTESEGPTLWHALQPSGDDAREITGIDMRVEHFPDDGEGRTEFAYAVPWGELGHEFSPEVGTQLSMTITSHDRRGEEGENWRNLGGGMLGGKEPFGLGVAELGESASGDEEPFTGVTIDQGSLDISDFSTFGTETATFSEFDLYAGDELGEGFVWMRWDEDNLYFAADIWNPEFVNDVGSGSANWDNDSFQIGIAPGQPGAESNFVEINFSDTEEDGPTLWHAMQPSGDDARAITDIDMRVEHSPDEGEGWTKFAYVVPWSELGHDFSPEVGKEFSMTIVSHDRRGEEGQNYRNLGGGMLGGKEPFGLGVAKFGP